MGSQVTGGNWRSQGSLLYRGPDIVFLPDEFTNENIPQPIDHDFIMVVFLEVFMFFVSRFVVFSKFHLVSSNLLCRACWWKCSGPNHLPLETAETGVLKKSPSYGCFEK